MCVSLVSTIKTTLAYIISAKSQRQFETNLKSSLETIRVHSEVLLVGNGPEKSKGLLLGGVKHVGLVVSSALDTLSELLILKFDKNLIEGVLEFYRFSLDVRGVCGKVELGRQTDQLCTLLVETPHSLRSSVALL
jgi:hypothetical protein